MTRSVPCGIGPIGFLRCFTAKAGKSGPRPTQGTAPAMPRACGTSKSASPALSTTSSLRQRATEPAGPDQLLQQPHLPQAGVAAAADDDVVVHGDPERACRLDDVAGD